MITMNTGPAKPGTGSDAPTGPGPHPAHRGAANRPGRGVVPGPGGRHTVPFALLARQVRVRSRTAAKRSAASAAGSAAVPAAVTVDVQHGAPAPRRGPGGTSHDAPPVHTGPVAVRRQAPGPANLRPGIGAPRAARAKPDTAANLGSGRVSADAGQNHPGGEAAQPPTGPPGRAAAATTASHGRTAQGRTFVAKGSALTVAVRGGIPRRTGSVLPRAGSASGPTEGVVQPGTSTAAQVDAMVSPSPSATGRILAPVRGAALVARGATVAELPPLAAGGWRISGLTLRPPAWGVGVQFRLNPPSARLGAILVRMAASGTRAHVVLSVRNSAWLKVLAADRAGLGSQLEPSLGRTAVEVTAGAGFGFGSSASDQANRPPPLPGVYGEGPEAAGQPTGGTTTGLDLRA